MSNTITLGFQSDSKDDKVTFFNLAIPKDGHRHQVSKLLDKATNNNSPVKVPADFQLVSILVSDPGHFSKDGKVEVDYPSGVADHRTSVDLTQDKNFVNLTAPLKEIGVKASK